jgi:hypothetical protein
VCYGVQRLPYALAEEPGTRRDDDDTTSPSTPSFTYHGYLARPGSHLKFSTLCSCPCLTRRRGMMDRWWPWRSRQAHETFVRLIYPSIHHPWLHEPIHHANLSSVTVRNSFHHFHSSTGNLVLPFIPSYCTARDCVKPSGDVTSTLIRRRLLLMGDPLKASRSFQ